MKTHGQSNTRLHMIWGGMIGRCHTKTNGNYARYGGRGVIVCDEWRTFVPFMNWALSHGYSDELQIDRIDNDGNYEPSNCRFVTRKVNVNNSSRAKRIIIFGETKTISEWSDDVRCRVNKDTFYVRMNKYGMTPREAMMREDVSSSKASKYRGVGKDKHTNKYNATLACDGKRHRSPWFYSERAAAAMYNVYAVLHHGNKAKVNSLK